MIFRQETSSRKLLLLKTKKNKSRLRINETEAERVNLFLFSCRLARWIKIAHLVPRKRERERDPSCARTMDRFRYLLGRICRAPFVVIYLDVSLNGKFALPPGLRAARGQQLFWPVSSEASKRRRAPALSCSLFALGRS